MKRIGNLYQTIVSLENLNIADGKAQKGKSNQYGVIKHNLNPYHNIWKLHNILVDKKYKTSNYDIFKVFEPKEREVYRLPYFPDRITHHAIMNVLEPIFMEVFTADSYSCIKGRGIHKASFNLRKALKNVEETKYCLKLDIKKFYPSVDHDILKILLRKNLKIMICFGYWMRL
ncbi:reverse transcriptase domain-containing protein [Chryseobacterium sp. 1B4]